MAHKHWQTGNQQTASLIGQVMQLLAMMTALLNNPARAGELAGLMERAERLLAQLIFEAAIHLSGRDDLRSAFEPRLQFTRSGMRFQLHPRLSGLPPLHQALFSRRRRALLTRYRRALGCRHRRSNKLSVLRARAHRRQQTIASARHAAHRQPSLHHQSRIAAPP